MKIAIKYVKGYPIFYAWNLDDSRQKTDFSNNVVYDGEDVQLYDELSKYGTLDVIAEGMFRFESYDAYDAFDALKDNVTIQVIINYPSEEEKEEFMTDLCTYGRS